MARGCKTRGTWTEQPDFRSTGRESCRNSLFKLAFTELTDSSATVSDTSPSEFENVFQLLTDVALMDVPGAV